MTVIPGLLLALLLALAGEFLSRLIGVDLMDMPKSPVSAIMLAILLGIVLGNSMTLADGLKPGIQFGLKWVLKIGIVLLGIRLGFADIGAIGLHSLPVILVTVSVALITVTYLARRLGLSRRLGTLIAVGTSICGATAIVATAPAIGARVNEVSYAVACVTLFGILAMLTYPFVAHHLFSADPLAVGLFLGTSVHDTSQVAGAGMVYQQYYEDPRVLDVATVTKLLRNLGMLIIVPLMCILHNKDCDDNYDSPKWWTMIPLFVIGFALMSLLRTIGDMGDTAFGILAADDWQRIIAVIRRAAEICLAIAMASVGLGTSIRGILGIGLKPLGVGLFSALLVGCVSYMLVSVIY